VARRNGRETVLADSNWAFCPAELLPPQAADGDITATGTVQPMARPFTVSVTSTLPRVALEYGHT
jgi:hypothetical protein